MVASQAGMVLPAQERWLLDGCPDHGPVPPAAAADDVDTGGGAGDDGGSRPGSDPGPGPGPAPGGADDGRAARSPVVHGT